MKKTNGFTLVELLAVIVVLAIIMVIAIPAVMNSMNKAKKRSFSLYGEKVLNAAQTKYLSEINFDGTSTGIFNIETDLDLSSTGNYKGYVVARNCNDEYEYVLVLQDGTYQIVGYSTSDGAYSEELVETYDANNFPADVNMYKTCGVSNNESIEAFANRVLTEFQKEENSKNRDYGSNGITKSYIWNVNDIVSTNLSNYEGYMYEFMSDQKARVFMILGNDAIYISLLDKDFKSLAPLEEDEINPDGVYYNDGSKTFSSTLSDFESLKGMFSDMQYYYNISTEETNNSCMKNDNVQILNGKTNKVLLCII